jgi:hypothetical protein
MEHRAASRQPIDAKPFFCAGCGAGSSLLDCHMDVILRANRRDGASQPISRPGTFSRRIHDLLIAFAVFLLSTLTKASIHTRDLQFYGPLVS